MFSSSSFCFTLKGDSSTSRITCIFPVLQTQFRHQLFELLIFFAKFADLTTVGLAHRIALQALLAGIQKRLTPLVIQAPSRQQIAAMLFSPFRPSKMIRIFFFGLNLRRVFRLISRTTDSGLRLVLGSIWFSFLRGYYNLKPSLIYSLNLSTFL